MQGLDETLNKRERYKARLRPYDYFKELESLDFENLGEGDRFYLQDFGIFNTDFLEDEFTIRLRIAAGRITVAQMQYIADIAAEHNLHVILTARGGMQLHGVEYDNVFTIFKQMNLLGLTTWQSFGDNIRNIVSDVYDGVGPYSEIEVFSIIQKMDEYILKNPRYVGMLPRRVSVGISGNRANVTSFFANDLYFALAQKGTMKGFNVYMGGKNTEVSQDADIFLQPHEVLDFFKAFVETFYRHGSRLSRSRTRLFYLIESIGMEGLKAHIEQEYGKPFEPSGTLLLQMRPFEMYERLKEGSYAFCYQTDFARLDADEMKKIAAYAHEQDAEIRIGIDQNLYLLGLKDKTVPFASPKQSATVLACAGNLCPYSFWSIKNETQYLPLEKISEHRIQVGFSGCAKGCGRHRHTDIGLIGLKTNHFGAAEGGARVYIGAEHSNGRSVGRMLFSMVPLVHLHELLSLVIALYEQSGYGSFEAFSAEILNGYSENFLALWCLANLQTAQTLSLSSNKHTVHSDESHAYEMALLKEHFAALALYKLAEENITHAISVVSKELWTVEGTSDNELFAHASKKNELSSTYLK